MESSTALVSTVANVADLIALVQVQFPVDVFVCHRGGSVPLNQMVAFMMEVSLTGDVLFGVKHFFADV